MLFSELNLSQQILKGIEDLGFSEATEIQSSAIPEILGGRDVIGKSSTGTGKTAAFALPIIENCKDSSDKASALILSPTRELAMQIAEEFRKFSKYVPGISVVTVYGGAPMDAQIRNLKTAKIIIGTPGRVMDHLRRKTLKLNQLKMLVLDEADEMLNMGFIDDIRTILETAPENRQTVLFSATMPKAILDITNEFQNDPVMVEVKSSQRTAENIDQTYYNIPQAGKIDALKLLLEYHKPERSLVFCNTKKMVDDLVEQLRASGFKAVGIHGDLKQSQRQLVMAEFKAGRSSILVATDVAARGIDVENVEAVFNYDIPKEYEYYIHRIGRTARAGRKGASYTLVANRTQLVTLKEIEKYVHAEISEKSVPSLESIAEHRMADFASSIREAIADGVNDDWKNFVEDMVAEGYDALDIASVLCAMRQKKNKRLVNVRNVASMGKKGTTSPSGNQTWLRISIGSDQKIGPNFIVGAIVEGAGIPKSAIGKINIFSSYTDVEMSKGDADLVISEMQDAKIKGRRVTLEKVSGGHSPARSFGDRKFGKSGGKKDYRALKSSRSKPQRSFYGPKNK